ncbi:MAG TPA: DegT/DnrJ/EryC1/StrS family aminotransferase [Pirellulales bacterium]|nr:DegT/DnrJ/EryC1/StrS family aminotransferase [Pirellulales bacterium]
MTPLPTIPASDTPAGVPLLDLNRHYAVLEMELAAAVLRVCKSGRYVLGPDCAEFEKELARYCQARHAVACASGSDALLLALMACGVGPGDEVLLPSHTFLATASAVARLGAKPVFVDIDPATFNLDVRQLQPRITSATKAIIPVHLYGQCADMPAVLEIARQHRLAVVEDAAQAIGAELAGRRAGSMGDIGCFSFYPTKNLGGFGDGGAVTANRDDLAQRLGLLHMHGMQPRYYHQVLGINSRLDSIQAAVLNVKLPHLDHWTAQRQACARRYTQLFGKYGLDRLLGLPTEAADRRHVWNQYVVRVPEGKRDALRAHLAQRKIGTEIYYPVPLHLQECFAYLGYAKGSLPETERAAAETLALPMFAELTEEEQALVVREVAGFFGPRHGLTGPKYLKRSSAQRPSESVERA